MNNWSGSCHRCLKSTAVHIMSMYNEELICLDCKKSERARDDYKKAEAKDLEGYAQRLRAMGMQKNAESVEQFAKQIGGSDG